MPTKPKSACPVCRRLNCICPPKKTERRRDRPPDTRRKRPRRKEIDDPVQRRRRREAVAAYRHQFGNVCQRCGRTHDERTGKPIVLSADHITPADIGGERGPLRVICTICNGELGAKYRNEKHRRTAAG